MKWIGRAHMYTGLFMAPWVLLYGVSGFIFNHITWFNGDASVRTPLPENALHSPALAMDLDPQAVAARVVAQLNDRLPAGDGKFQLAPNSRAEFVGQLSLQGTDPNSDSATTISVNLDDHIGFVQRRGVAKPAPTGLPRAIDPLVEAPRLAELKKELIGAAQQSDPSIANFTFGNPTVPDLLLKTERNGQAHIGRYNLRTGQLTLRASHPLPTPLFLTRLHVSHFYPNQAGWTWIWAVIVDLSAILLCFWAITGIAMWFQIKIVRTSGVVLLILAVLVTFAVALAMHREITRFL